MFATILPTPKKSELFEGTVTLPLKVFTANPQWQEYIDTLNKGVDQLYEVKLEIGKGGIELVLDKTIAPEHYVFDSRDGIKLIASDDQGICYALATAFQMFVVKDGQIVCERALIEDYPEKEYRALMVDLARSWHPADKIYKYIDVCFMLKVNYLHLHFIDDQSYTLPSKVFPKISSKKHYTFEDIEGFRKYAAARKVYIIPEFEAPGHASSLTKSYPEVFANNIENSDSAQTITEEGVKINADSIICASKKECIDGVKALIEEIAQMFPESPYIHIGGDEANIKAWTLCSDCIKYMQENGIEDEYELYSDFVARVAQMVIDLGKTPIVWEGFPKKGAERVPRETVVIAWESHYHMVEDLLEEGFKVINASWQPLYIVDSFRRRWGPRELLEWNVYNWQHWWEHSEAKLNPKHVPPTDRVLGAQVCSWYYTYECDIQFIMENMTTLSERLWTVRRLWDEDHYLKRHKATMKILAKYIQDK